MNNPFPSLSRRSFLGAVTGAAACSLAPGRAWAQGDTPPNSKFNGVQIGVITYSYRSMPSSAEQLLKYIVASGINAGVELMGDAALNFAHASKYAGEGGEHATGYTAGYKALRKLYNDAGVNIDIVKFGNIGDHKMTDEQLDAYFLAAKALGAKGITRELDEGAAKRLGPFADKHEIILGFHNHTNITPTTYDGDILSYGKYLGINLDIGHYVAATGESPVPLIEKHHDRIISLHLKDRKKGNGPNMPWGQGDTPIGEVLKYMKKNQLAFPAEIELEYNVPAGSDAIKEVVKCVQFCKDALA